MLTDSGPDRATREFAAGLLEGEPRTSGYADDAQQWVAVYTELVAFTSRVLVRQTAFQQDEAGGALEASDEQRLSAHLQRLVPRLKFWRLRLRELAGIEIDPQGRTLSYKGTTVGLTDRESQLLQFLSEHPGKAYTAPQLILQAWHAPELSDEELRTYLVRLRRWIATLQLPCTIVNRPRHGYTFRFNE